MKRFETIESPAALVLCGGASRGAIEVGFYRALCELGVAVDLLVGASIGALNGACIASGMTVGELVSLWRRFAEERPIGWNWRGLIEPRRQPGLYSLERLRRLLRRSLPATRFEELEIPPVIATTDLLRGAAVYWEGTGDFIEPLIASVSVPGLFPPVTIGGRPFADGSIADNVPIGCAVARGGRTILTITCGSVPRDAAPPRGLYGVIERSLAIAMHCKYTADVRRFAAEATIYNVAPVLPRPIGILDFRHTAELIELGYREALAYLTAEDGNEGH